MEIKIHIDDRLVRAAAIGLATLGVMGAAYATQAGIIIFAPDTKIKAVEMNANFAYQEQQLADLTQQIADLQAQTAARAATLGPQIAAVQTQAGQAQDAVTAVNAANFLFAVQEQTHVDALTTALNALGAAQPN